MLRRVRQVAANAYRARRRIDAVASVAYERASRLGVERCAVRHARAVARQTDKQGRGRHQRRTKRSRDGGTRRSHAASAAVPTVPSRFESLSSPLRSITCPSSSALGLLFRSPHWPISRFPFVAMPTPSFSYILS
eukprot:4321233-Pleurochrysis_carterae.AAC.1